MENNTEKKRIGKKSIALLIVLGVLIAVLLVAGFFLYRMLKRPEALFRETEQATATPDNNPTPLFEISQYLSTESPAVTDSYSMPSETPEADQLETSETPTEMPEIEDNNTSQQTPDDSLQTDEPETTPEVETDQQQVNNDETAPDETVTAKSDLPNAGITTIALFGIDAKENGGTTSGTEPHTDVNMAVAINFDTKEVSLISIARDVLTTAPDHSGFYKFNCIFNVGGGMKNHEAGFDLACRAMGEWLGGVPVSYYYAVDFQAVIDLVDAIGGIDYYVEEKLPPRAPFNSKPLQKGQQHLDGLKVLQYLRSRTGTSDGLDSSRTARQRKMLIALFKKIKDEGQLSMIPEIIRIMGNNIYTNTTIAQTTALANFANQIDPDNIQSYSISGQMQERYTWKFCFIDQQNRIDILKKVYGIDAGIMAVDTVRYEKYLQDTGFTAIQHINIAKKLLAEVHSSYTEETMTEKQKTAYAQFFNDYSTIQEKFNEMDTWMRAHCDEKKSLTKSESKQQMNYYAVLRGAENNLRKSADTFKKEFSITMKTYWNRNPRGFYENPDINEVLVDFR